MLYRLSLSWQDENLSQLSSRICLPACPLDEQIAEEETRIDVRNISIIY